MTPPRQTLASEQAAEFNRLFPVGTRVRLRRGNCKMSYVDRIEAMIDRPAITLYGTPVAHFRAVTGWYTLDRIERLK